MRRLTLILVSIVCFASLIGCDGSYRYGPPADNQNNNSLVPMSLNLINGTITVPANNYYYKQFTVTQNMQNAAITGSFYASGGSGNDIKVLVLDSVAFTNWANGHSVSAYYNSGQLTTSSFNQQLPVGTYYLIFDNRFSVISGKQVNTQIDLGWQELQ